MHNPGAAARTQVNAAPLHLPSIGHSAAHYSPSLSEASFLLPRHASLRKSKPTPHVLEDLFFSPGHLQLPTLQKSETKSLADQGSSPSWLRTFPPGSRACCAAEVAIPALPRAGELPGAALLSPACLLRRRCAVQPAASPAPSPQRPHNSCGLNYQNNILIVS